jgi:hypothetical protein
MPQPAMGFAPSASAPSSAPAPERAGDVGQAWGRSPRESADLVGTTQHDMGERILAALPAGLREKLREPEIACAAIVALLLAQKDSVLQEQLAAVRKAGAAKLADAAAGLAGEVGCLAPAYHLPVVDLALPAVKAAGEERQRELLAALEAVVHADRRVSMHEFVLLTLMRSQLAQRKGVRAPRFKSLEEVSGAARLLLSLVAYAGAPRGDGTQLYFEAAFQAGAREMGLAGAQPFRREELDLEKAAAVLEKLRDLAPLPKGTLMAGLFAAVNADRTIRVVEAELLRTIGAVLDCPLPPMLQALDPASLAA